MMMSDDNEYFCSTLHSIPSGILATIKQQVKDLVPEGRYGSVTEKEQEHTQCSSFVYVPLGVWLQVLEPSASYAACAQTGQARFICIEYHLSEHT